MESVVSLIAADCEVYAETLLAIGDGSSPSAPEINGEAVNFIRAAGTSLKPIGDGTDDGVKATIKHECGREFSLLLSDVSLDDLTSLEFLKTDGENEFG